MGFLTDEGHAQPEVQGAPKPHSAPTSAFAILVWILSVPVALIGVIALMTGASDHSDAAIDTGIALTVVAVLFAALGAIINKLAQIEWHLRNHGK
jgi:hypothetical protein